MHAIEQKTGFVYIYVYYYYLFLLVVVKKNACDSRLMSMLKDGAK